MLILAGTVRLPPENLPAARLVIARMVAASRAEPGCIAYSFAEDLEEPGLLRIFEVFRDREAQQAHAASQHMKDWRATWEDLGIGDKQITHYEVLATAES
ncbi:MAG: antibiotic biosynthesis monooxygenase [Alphaproteobacteria bacterium]|nr:antibiotic biosynthesis monooxygenase [Alphaproteobacteria bacterium]MBU0795426.1 antibiotic biosynthesis monooxygenase [Alphaproteobacteria bacterium]MBU0877079.1 antibiotic biosynthesis monooxygenase [Alphaproteobacteria bacterium]MBU1770905.1 antibiotic biosynthesis monooxygenase [Alphaproteobacteria bacterium]